MKQLDIKKGNRWAIRLTFVILGLFITYFLSAPKISAQIYEPEGLNMPGAWNGWTNPPTNNLALASSTQVTNGRVVKISTGTIRWQTIFSVGATDADVVGGNYEWKFTSGPQHESWNNQWTLGDFDQTVAVNLNTLEEYKKHSLSNPNSNTITITNGKWYTMNWEDKGYANTRAIFMETSAEPVSISTVSEPVGEVDINTPVEITITTSANPCAEELFYLRYTIDNWTSSSVVLFSMTNSSGTVEIPGQTSGTAVNYYVFSSSVSGITSDYDLYTIKLNNKTGTNYTYTVGAPYITWANLQSPATGKIEKESEFKVYARVLVPTITGSGAPGGGPANLNAWIGYSTTNATSVADFSSGWTWVAATYNTYDAAFGNSSQYSADIGTGITPLGTYYFVSRFQYDGGDYKYGGFNGGFWDGTTNLSGVLTVVDEIVTYPVTLTVINNSTEVTGVKVAGSFNGWTVVDMLNPSGNTWTFTTNLEEGTYQWKPTDQDGDWLFSGDNLSFSVASDGAVTGSILYTYPEPNYGLRDDAGTNLPTITYWFTGSASDVTEKGSQFNAKDLGEITQLLLKGSNIKTWKTGTGNVTGAKLSYKVWKTSEAEPAEYTDRNVGFTSNDGDGNQTWSSFGTEIDVTSGLAIGNYSIKILFSITGEGYPGTVQDGPFTAVFEIPPSQEANILTFTFPQQTGDATINVNDRRVDIQVAYGTSLTSLTPIITVSPFATISPLSNVAQNFSSPFEYTVTAQDGTTQKVWTIHVTVAAAPSSAKEITGFTLTQQTGAAVINSGNATVTIEVAHGTDVTNLTPTITISPLASIDPASGVARNFSSPVTYTVTAEDITTKVWTVTVTIAAPPDPNYGMRDDAGANLPTITYWYSDQGTDITEKGSQFNTKNIGDITDLYIKGTTIKTWKITGGDVTSAKFSFKVWKTGETEPASYTERNIGFSTNDGDGNQTWASFGDQIDVTGSLDLGTYNFKILFSIEGTGIPGITQNGPFTATFVKVEPPAPGITFANLQFPGTGNVQPESEFLVYAQTYIEGITGSGAPTNGVSNLSAWIGYSTTNATTAADFATGWTWVPATYNTYETGFGNNSQYSADIGTGITAEGTYYYVSRFQYNNGDFVYGGFSSTGGGFWNGTSNISGVLTVEEEPTPTISWANLQHPQSGEIEPESEFLVFARVLVDGQTGTNSPAGGVEGLNAWIGYSTTNATTVADFETGWTWVVASYNSYETAFGNNSQYSADIGTGISSDGTFYYVSRFKLGDGDYVYGGFSASDGGFWDGTTNISGILTVQTQSTSEISWANIQYPENGNIEVGADFTVYAQVYIEGQTGSAAPSQGVANLSAWIGYSTTNATSVENFETGWTWVDASYNTYETTFGNNSQYSADIGTGIEAEGTYYYVSRFKLGNGSYVYGGYSASGGGFWDGTTNASGVLTVDAEQPATFPVTFTIIDETEEYINIKLRIEIDEDWATHEMTESDHVWTKTLDLLPGTYSWGAIEDDGSDDGIWLIEEGELEVTVADNGDITGTTSYTVNPVSVNFDAFSHLRIYPNPTSDFVNVQSLYNADFKIVDISGRVVASGNLNRDNSMINLSTFQSGVYFIQFNFEGKSTVRKIVKL